MISMCGTMPTDSASYGSCNSCVADPRSALRRRYGRGQCRQFPERWRQSEADFSRRRTHGAALNGTPRRAR
jgi:hypothetical protein